MDAGGKISPDRWYSKEEGFMGRKEIIFFDELGFGWVVDRRVLQQIHDKARDEEIMVEKTLADLLQCT
jgi:hypothetical protein